IGRRSGRRSGRAACRLSVGRKIAAKVSMNITMMPKIRATSARGNGQTPRGDQIRGPLAPEDAERLPHVSEKSRASSEWLMKLKPSNPAQARVIGMSMKDRPAILPVGHGWLHASFGGVNTAAFRTSELPC